MHGFTYMIGAPEGKRKIADAATYSCQWHQLFYLFGRFNKIYCVIIMLFQTGSNSKNVWIKNYILRIKAYFFCKYFIGTMRYLNFFFFCISLAVFIKCHNDDR